MSSDVIFGDITLLQLMIDTDVDIEAAHNAYLLYVYKFPFGFTYE